MISATGPGYHITYMRAERIMHDCVHSCVCADTVPNKILVTRFGSLEPLLVGLRLRTI
jgi:hypothetical protein